MITRRISTNIKRSVLVALAVAIMAALGLAWSSASVYAEDSRTYPSDMHDMQLMNLDNPEYFLTDINGNQVSTRANGKPKILFFFNYSCPRCMQVESVLREYGLNLNKADVIFAEAAHDINDSSLTSEEKQKLRDEAAAFYEGLGIDTTSQCYGAVKTCWKYLGICGYPDTATKKPIVVYISEDNRIMAYSWSYTNVYTAALSLGINLEKGGHHWETVVNDKTEDGYIETFNRCAACRLERIHSIELLDPEVTDFTYNGSAKSILRSNSVFDVEGGTATAVGQYTATIKLKDTLKYVWAKGDYKADGSDGDFRDTSISWSIHKGSQKPVINTGSKSFRQSALKKGSLSFTLSVTGAKGKKSFVKTGGSTRLTLNKTTGKVTVKKGTKKGKYRIKVKVKCAATSNYNGGTSAVKTVTVTVK